MDAVWRMERFVLVFVVGAYNIHADVVSGAIPILAFILAPCALSVIQILVPNVPIVVCTIVMADAKTQAPAVEAEVQPRLILLLILLRLLEIQ